ncbi:hypothetical protein CBR_g37389 [Chara braunii]|uniref:Reverse transcriptase domain-containing protein n=1 Tax=Chara braunii TaxID=69332 RepID=A0A388K028_CHABU|nr:hypothetical protein CBR_g37389 [Chara braunii]|eukprot:GBG63303.1 hypothetical protein CBR_g37389 [Chara braunii]
MHWRSTLKPSRTTRSTATQQLEQRICATTTTPSSAPREMTPKFDGQEIFCDSTKTDPIPWFRKFELKLRLHHVSEDKHHVYLYSRWGGACQACLDNLLYRVVAADLYNKISWDDLKAAWHKRFQVEPPEIKAMDKLLTFEQGTLLSVDWIAEYQCLTSVSNIQMGFKAAKHYSITRSCPASSNALTHVEDTLTTMAELFDKAVQIIVTNKEAKNLNRSSATGPSRDQHRLKVVVVVAASQPTNLARPCLRMKEADSQPPEMVAAPAKVEDAARRRQTSHLSPGPARQLQPYGPTTVSPNVRTSYARDSAIVCGVTAVSTTQWAARRKAKANRETDHPLCAHLHTYLSFYAPPTSPMGDEAAVGDILAYVTEVAREFREQRYDDNNAPLLYVHIQVGQASYSALLDSSASRNFMNQAFMQRVGLGAQVRRKANPTAIKLANGRTQQLIDRYIEAVPVYFAPHACEPVTFDILDTDFDIVLGMPWLASADHTVNFNQRTLTVRDAVGAALSCTIPLPHFDPMPSGDGQVFTDIFESPTGVVPDRPISHETIFEAGAVPPIGCIYRMSEEELTVLHAQLDDLLDKGWIRPSSSPYGAPVLFLWKKNNDLRLCIDYRKLNVQTVKNVGPLPRIDDLLERSGGAKFFSKLDLKLGYHEISIRPNDRYKSAFKTRYGHFEWVVMPFGLTNAPVTFQAAMTNEFRAMLDRFVLVYLEDILVYSRTLEGHLEHLQRVLETLRRAKYNANRAKCEFVWQELEYLGHFVTLKGIKPLSDKIQGKPVSSAPHRTRVQVSPSDRQLHPRPGLTS